MITYCNKCLYPNTKPDLHFNDQGICSACQSFENRGQVDWEQRRKDFLNITDKYKSKNGSNYDCIVPVSGGKDSTFQVIRLLELGLNPLCVTATTDSLSDIGRENIENIKSLGVDYQEITQNPKIRRKINATCLRELGDISWPEHVAIFTLPVRAAVQHKVPLIVWGENPQNEYGGPAASGQSDTLNRRWLEEFGGLIGFRVSDLVGQNGIEQHHLLSYRYPSDDELQSVGVTGVFLGYFFPWDGFTNALYAQCHGFKTFPTCVEGSIANYENLDNHQTGIHDYFKFLKFGFGRATDIANNHIRRGRLTRSDALSLTRLHDGAYPWTCLGKPLEEILRDINMSLDEFDKICDRFTNKKLFRTTNDGSLIKDAGGNLIKINYDNE
ncbi:N-acetyl sugar amidotransferase [Magnetovibrio blakemorei]|uniref:Flagellin modification protein, PseA n=1 Tax=Magnetovibrio blakemorei TaxID=28181 RepID=A0A1E5Q6J0_9PROT|nr:N-acetyl sugar amidotransferase [Magnetovibrio blakemorei]OEJ66322.1 flagellin modification protein, PseA [Magnetovibrio blakemorei]